MKEELAVLASDNGFFPTIGDWTRESFKALCKAIVEAGNTQFPNEDDWRYCRFCGRGTNLWIGTQFAAPDFCNVCTDQLDAWDVQAYLCLLEESEAHGGGGVGRTVC